MKIYFVSDFHLGIDARLTSEERERKIVRWFDQIKQDATEIYLVGDVFDFWFEYKRAVPKGYVRLFGKLAELRDQGIPIYFFTGNHDMWMFRYFEEEFDIPIYRKYIIRELMGKQFLIGHGDGLGPKDYKYKLLKKVLANPFCQWCYERLHPNLGLWLMKLFSSHGRPPNSPPVKKFYGADKEWLIQYANRKLDSQDIDYFIFGHRHLPIEFTLKNGKSRYINLGEWLHYCSYAVFDGEKVELKFFENEDGLVFG